MKTECLVTNGPDKGKLVLVPDAARILKLARPPSAEAIISKDYKESRAEMEYTVYKRIGDSNGFEVLDD